jgi:radical SAM superfamily enzyme YgiQ (UPF0313 family)
MKVIFVNPPHVRSRHATLEHDFRLPWYVTQPKRRKKGLNKKYLKFLERVLRVDTSARYGVRAGSRWPWTQPTPTWGSPHYPFFMGWAASHLRSKGIAVNILDAVADEIYDYHAFLDETRAEKADIVVIECSTPTIDIDVWFTSKVAKFADVALAGPHLNKDTIPEIQSKHPEIKYYLEGEYILSAGHMVDKLEPGVYPSEVLKDVDSIPFAFRDYKSATKYYDPTMPTPRPQLQIYGSKGCPFKCTFCAWPQNMYYGNVGVRKPENIAAEIRDALSKNDYKSIFFDDDTWNLGTRRVADLCDHLKAIGLPWTMMGRLDISPNWLYDKMVNSGCVGMRFGVETFSLDVLKRVEKGIERVDFRAALEHLSRTYPDIFIHITMMKDMPGQTEEIHQEDMRIIHGMGFTEHDMRRSYQLSRCAPFPGTKLYEQMKALSGDEVMKNYKGYDGGQDTVMKVIQIQSHH